MASRVSCTFCTLFFLFTGFGTAFGASRNIWLSAAEIQALPMSGAAWNNVRSGAYANWGTVTLADQNSKAAAYAVAGAMVWARAGDATLRVKVRDAIMAAKHSLDEDSEYSNSGARVLSLARQLGGWVIAADLIDLASFDSAADAEFRPWLDQIRTRVLPNSGCPSIKQCHESLVTGWGMKSGYSRIAADLYLGDNADLSRAAIISEAALGNRAIYPADAPGGAYFNHSADWDAGYMCDPTNWRGISPSCVLTISGQQVNMDGAVVEQVSRSSGTVWPPDATGMMYTWEGLGALFLQAEMLYRAGYPSYSWESQALHRAMDFMVRAGWSMQYDLNRFIPWIANLRYNESYTALTTTVPAYSTSWTDWTHASAGPPPVDLVPPAAITDLATQ